MLEQSWLNQALGSDEGSPDSDHFGEAATMSSVVQGFLNNEAGFTDEDIARYINSALQNEAGDLWLGRADGLETAEAWRGRADQALSDLDPVGATVSARKHDAMLEATSDRYNLGRTDFLEALHTVRSSAKVPLAPETRAWVITLDHDGYLSASMGAHAGSMFAANPILSQMKPRLVDFSRESAVLKLSQDSPSASAGAERDAVRARGRVIDALRQYRPASDDAAQTPSTEPEVA